MTKPIGHWTKEVLQDWLRIRSIPFDESYPIGSLRTLVAKIVRDKKEKGEQYWVVDMEKSLLKASASSEIIELLTGEPNEVSGEKPSKETLNVPASEVEDDLIEMLPKINLIPPSEDDFQSTKGENFEEESIDEQLRVAEKKLKLFRLQCELMKFSKPLSNATKSDFDDVKHSMPQFTNSDEYDANKWISDFERACDTVNGDDVFRLKAIKRMMKPNTEAEWFLRIDTSQSYIGFRENFLANFGHIYTISEVMEKLKKTTFNASKTSVMGYILKMQELASRARVDEQTTIAYVIDGFQDRSANIAMLYQAKTISELKRLSHRYAQLRESNGLSTISVTNSNGMQQFRPRSTNRFGTSASANTSANTSASASASATNAIRCYNCSGFGHFSGACTEPRRPRGSCFTCGSTQHIYRDCPKKTAQRTVAMIDGSRAEAMPEGGFVHETDNEAISAVNEVSVTFLLENDVDMISNFLCFSFRYR